ncbi:betaine/proline/choline family ABC transporter ATP-binding protein [Spiractinospora alimapuensis]|uniref:betaine/proline/choline family ABC transporter ATP-binding protein n=1 Tax=Spiractinospora alimapuensis TaxID=2820884 RepID=UPI001EEABEEC|nr:betaine/proline/choline family ABC transporter ATP-binding protein [Spiractinospora alimapuensis]QVQ53034.1 betaine/proline/choline family ABC transporter ATP-binding protein [Spiractinospora alimapuensis]
MTTKIHLENLTKRFPGQQTPAVDDLTMEIPEGEVVVFVGPSGCGKTTTMKLINRLIEPTSGRIRMDDVDVTHVNPDQLRRQIGYVIQQIGLFPHMTIHDNIATVPKLLKWNPGRIKERVEELLTMVGMDPGVYARRYPKELSGGQRQRVGVARAMSADPDVMLMDEPFGAIDPITRDRLQNEFLRIQSEIKKTIVFVTHDIDEAIKMGDRIAILRERSQVVQYDTPERILVAPENDFVADFIGRGAGLKRLNLSRVADIEIGDWPTLRADATRADVEDALRRSDQTAVLVLDHDDRPRRWLGRDHLDSAVDGELDRTGLLADAVVRQRATLSDALNEMLVASFSTAIVVDDDDRYRGTVDIHAINEAVRGMRAAERGRASGQLGVADADTAGGGASPSL